LKRIEATGGEVGMRARSARGGALVVTRFSANAIGRIRRLGIDVMEFFAPLAKLFHSIASQLSFGLLAMEAERRLGVLSLTRVRLVPPAAWSGRERARPAGAYGEPAVEVPNVALMLHVSVASRLEPSAPGAAAKRGGARYPVQAPGAAPRIAGGARAQGDGAGAILRGAPSAPEPDQAGPMPTLPLLAAALLPALAFGRVAVPIVGVGAPVQPAATGGAGRGLGGGGAQGRGAGGAAGGAAYAHAQQAVAGGAASALQPSGALAKRIGSSDAYAIAPAGRQAGTPPEGQEVKAGELPEAAAPAAAAAEGTPQAWAWAAFAPLFAALGRASLAVRQQAAGRTAHRVSGAMPEGAAYGGTDMSDSLLAVMSLQRGLSATMPSFSAIKGIRGRPGGLQGGGGLRAPALGALPEGGGTAGALVEEPTFGDRLSAPTLGTRAAQQRAAMYAATASEERALQALDMMRRPEMKVEPVFGVKGTGPSVNIEVSAYSEEDLKDLERKIERILQDQVRRSYGIL
jgi:hypothetical protein